MFWLLRKEKFRRRAEMYFNQLSFITLLLYISFVSCFSDECKKHCESTFPLHTTDEVADHGICLIGCRLQYLSSLTHDNESADKNCETDCANIYTHDEERLGSCKIGCKASFPESGYNKLDDLLFDYDLRWHMQLMHPVFAMKRFCVGFVSGASTYAWSTYIFQQGVDDNNLIIQVQLTPSEDEFSIVTNKASDDLSPKKGFVEQAYEHSSRWLQCVERRSGIPYIHVVTILCFSIFFIAWISCATCDDDGDKEDKVSGEKISCWYFYKGSNKSLADDER